MYTIISDVTAAFAVYMPLVCLNSLLVRAGSERVGVGVEKVGHDEGSEVPRENGEVDHDPLQVVVEVSTKQCADRGEGGRGVLGETTHAFIEE